MGRPLTKAQRQHRIAEARRKSIANRPIGMAVHPHVTRKLKVVPMKDKDGNPIPWNPDIIHGGPWPDFKHGIKINEQNAHTPKRR
jgi:hypothetical protein